MHHVNEKLGREAGDELLREISRSLEYNHELMVVDDTKRWAREQRRRKLKAVRFTLPPNHPKNPYIMCIRPVSSLSL